jgi:uncharacterized protein
LITETLLHCAGIGQARQDQLHSSGIRSWSDALRAPEKIPAPCRASVMEECRRSLAALEAGNIGYFVEHFCGRDQWRILQHYLDQTSFFDIETAGLEFSDPITVIACWHDGALHTFVEHENLDEFLELLDQVTLLASFNGSSFDVPRVLNAFHIPQLPCAHLDLRWACYHRGYVGGLKQIADRLGIVRPADLHGADGLLATWLWQAWDQRQDSAARNQLVRYCAADVLMLQLVAERVIERETVSLEQAWAHLPPATAESTTVPAALESSALDSPAPVRAPDATSELAANRSASAANEQTISRPFADSFGRGNPSRLRAWRRRAGD